MGHLWRQVISRRWIAPFLNRNLPPDRRITFHTVWPLFLLPWLLLWQLIDPSPLWMVLLVTLVGIYAIGLIWVRALAVGIGFTRRRRGTLLVVGDVLAEEFVLENASVLPLLWAVFEDSSYLPDYTPSQVVGCGGNSSTRWKGDAVCQRRGVFRLGPHRLHSGDPFGLFRLEIDGDGEETLLVYPRVVHLPPVDLPRGRSAGRDRRRRPLMGDLRAPLVRPYAAGDSLRHIHWPTTAHRGHLMVTEMEEEPSGDLWIVLDLNTHAQSGSGENSTLEYGVILAASLAAELLGGKDRRAVGLLAVGEHPGQNAAVEGERSVLVAPQRGQGQLWRLLAALAPISAGSLPVADLLHRNRNFVGKGHSLVLITPDVGDRAPLWIAELLGLRRAGIESSVIAVLPAQEDAQADSLSELLAEQEIAARFVQAGTPLPRRPHLSSPSHNFALHPHRRCRRSRN